VLRAKNLPTASRPADLTIAAASRTEWTLDVTVHTTPGTYTFGQGETSQVCGHPQSLTRERKRRDDLETMRAMRGRAGEYVKIDIAIAEAEKQIEVPSKTDSCQRFYGLLPSSPESHCVPVTTVSILSPKHVIDAFSNRADRRCMVWCNTLSRKRRINYARGAVSLTRRENRGPYCNKTCSACHLRNYRRRPVTYTVSLCWSGDSVCWGRDRPGPASLPATRVTDDDDPDAPTIIPSTAKRLTENLD